MSACLFCRIVNGELPAEHVAGTDDLIAIRDIAPQAPTHLLIIPRRHVASPDGLTEKDRELAGAMVLLATRLAHEAGLHEAGYRLVLNCGRDGGQSVPHLHLHLLGGRRLGWPPG